MKNLKALKLFFSIVLLVIFSFSIYGQTDMVLLNDAVNQYRQKNYESSFNLYQKYIEKDTTYELAYYNGACSASLIGKKEVALEYLEKSIKKGYTNIWHIEKDSDFKNINETEEWERILEELRVNNDKVVKSKIEFQLGKKKDKFYEIDRIKEIIKEKGIHLVGSGNPIEPPNQSYSELISEVFEDISKDEKNKEFVKKILVDHEMNKMKEIDKITTDLETPSIYFFTAMVRPFTKGGNYMEYFWVSVQVEGKEIYSIKANCQNPIKLIYSLKAREDLKQELLKEISKIMP
ncbi:MAG: hypothetical protein AB8F94_00220 [Saprospiraceae bacterium]